MSARAFAAALWVAALGAGPWVFAESTLAPGDGQRSEAKITFASTVFDFGKVQSGEVVKHDFVFTNTGSATLEVIDVKPGCGCTTAGSWDKKVEPGKTGTIPLQFNSGAFNGPVTKSATVTSSDPMASNVVLQLTGTIWKPIEIIPEMVVFSTGFEVQSNETKTLRIVSNLDEPITLSDLECTNRSFKAELKTVRPGREFELLLTAVPPFASSNVFGRVTLKTSLPQVPVIEAKAYVIAQPAVTVTPQPAVAVSRSISPTARVVPTRVTTPVTAAK